MEASRNSEAQEIFSRVTEHVPQWKKILKSPADICFKRQSGLSNACFRVWLKDPSLLDGEPTVPKVFLYRRFEQDLTDKRIEQAIFQVKSDDGTGPKLFYQNSTYRIESFFEGRPLTIWEMRNPMIGRKYAELMVDYNFSPVAREKISEVHPLDKSNMFIHQVIKEWGPTLEGNLDAIEAQIQSGLSEGVLPSDEAQERLDTVKELKQTLLFEGYLQYFEKLIPIPEEPNDEATFPIVLCHNDAQENNLLMSHENNRQLLVIDYEYAGWNPMAMDVANFLNETMLENAYPLKNGINWYIDNILETHEVETISKRYLECYYAKYMSEKVRARYSSQQDFITKELSAFMGEVYACAMLNNFFWGVWALALLKPEQCREPGLFNFDFALARVDMFKKVQELKAGHDQIK